MSKILVSPTAALVGFTVTLLAGVVVHVSLLDSLERALAAGACFLVGGWIIEYGVQELIRALKPETKK